ncbi:hypothetical protein NDU88_004406 [Pleurodeles waltl]|uniref:Myb/SANT-like DNA-binding domain-containing protein n=1 Tax=Pleurodeles waltl TaxID=8319 RepID=A0AAV7LL99_PLEWA|nr:hypothetical protein NDU88_004406 [Pleurodeles waltl]
MLGRPQEDDNRPGTSQEDPHKTQERKKKKRKCCFSAEEQEILVKEVTEPQHQLFISSKLPISRREAIWQQIVDKINCVAEVRRTVIECKKHWHDCKRRTKEKMARNRKAALQPGGGSPAPQESLDHMEEIVAAIIPEEIVTGIQGQDSADYQETTQMQGSMTAAGDVWVPVDDVCAVVGAMLVGGGAGGAVIGSGAMEVDGPAVVPDMVGSTWVVVVVLVVAAMVDTEEPPWANALQTPKALSWQ